jgi:hypothetical protein
MINEIPPWRAKWLQDNEAAINSAWLAKNQREMRKTTLQIIGGGALSAVCLIWLLWMYAGDLGIR